MAGALDGIRILDISTALTGPYPAALLCDQGADVIKVERPGLGDLARWVGVAVNGVSALFQSCNRGKRSIALDIATPEGLAIVRELAARSDVVIQNMRPGVADRLGIGWKDLSAGREDLVYISLSGFGQTGPYAQRGAYDTVIQAYAGLGSNQSDPEDGTPVFLRQTAADKITAMYAVQAITAALFARERGKSGTTQLLSLPREVQAVRRCAITTTAAKGTLRSRVIGSGRRGRAAIRHEHVAEAPYRLNVAWVRRIQFDQLSQSGNLHVDGAIEHFIFATARQFHELVARKRCARMRHQHLEQGEFASGERHGLAFTSQRARRKIHLHAAETDFGGIQAR